jgi:hypothetical protein
VFFQSLRQLFSAPNSVLFGIAGLLNDLEALESLDGALGWAVVKATFNFSIPGTAIFTKA